MTDTLLVGGAERQIIYLTKALGEKYNVKLIVYYGNLFDEKYRALTVEFSENVIWLEGSHLSKLYRIYKLFRKNKGAVVISFLAAMNIVNAVVGKISGTSVRIGGIMSTTIKKHKLFPQKLAHNYLLTSTISNNHAVCPYLIQKGFNPQKLFVVHNCIGNVPEFFRKPLEHAETVKIVSLSRFVWQKDLLTALKAIQLLKNELNGKFKYILAGYGQEEQSLRSSIDKMNLSDHIEMIIKPDVEKVLKEGDIFLMTSVFEGTSNSIMEGMAYGMPVVTTNAGDAKYLVEDGNTGFVCEKGDFVSIAASLKNLVQNRELITSFGKNGYKKITEEFSVTKLVQGYLNQVG